MDETIIRFLKGQTCATICCTDEAGKPYCFNCYYLADGHKGLLYFKTSADTHHASLLAGNPVIAGTILPDKLIKLVVRGVQWQGELLPLLHPLAKDAYLQYHRKYAMALAIKGEVFTIQINSIKMTDSSLGFGKKTSWSREALSLRGQSI